MPVTKARFEWNEAEFVKLNRSLPIKRLIRDEGMKVLRRAQLDAPKSETGSDGRPPGYLASQIKLSEGEWVEGPVVFVRTTARSPRGFFYGAYWQSRRPYLRAGTSLTKG